MLSSTIQINSSGTWRANGHNVTISGRGAVQMFVINFGVNVTMEGLRLVDGYLRGTTGFTGGPGGAADGGAILNFGFLTCNQCVFEGNRVFGGIGGPPFGSPGSLPGNGGPGRGGAICIGAGQVVLTDCIFRNNQSSGGRAGTPSAGTPSNSLISGDSRGGALYAIGGGYTLTRCFFFQNQATLSPGEIQNGQSSGAGEGGAIFLESASLSASDCVINTNIAFGGDGAPAGGNGGAGRGAAVRGVAANILMRNCSMEANSAIGGSGGTASSLSAVTIGASAEGGAIYCTGGNVTLADCRLMLNRCVPGYFRRSGVNYGTADAFGGAVTVKNGTILSLTRCMLNENSARSDLAGSCWGGAIYVNGQQLTLEECQLSGNQAEGGRSGPIVNTVGGVAGHGFGGGVYVQSGRLFSSNSTFSANTAAGGIQTYLDSTGGNGLGGGLLNHGTGVVENCTFNANMARGGDAPANGSGGGGNSLGGALYNDGGLVLSHATIASNIVRVAFGMTSGGQAQGGGIYSSGGGSELRALILSGNTGSNWFGASLSDRGYNLSSDASCPFTDATSMSNVDPVIGPPGDFGGPTLTMPLLSGSPAIDRVVTGACPLRDQRGRARPYGAACDVGAFESSAPFTVRGRVSGPWVPAGVQVANGAITTATAADFSYRFDGLSPGSYVITPSVLNYLSLPRSQTVSLTVDTLGIDFLAFKWNALFVEKKAPGLMRLLYAGTNGNILRIQSAVTPAPWQDYSTNEVGADGVIELDIPTSEPQRLFRAVIP